MADQMNCEDVLVKTLKDSRKRHGKNLIFAHVNVNSLGEKCDYFRDLLLKNLFDILCITETKLSEYYVTNDLHVEGYKLHRKDKDRNSGGIVVWVRSDIPHFRDTDLEFSVENAHIESLVINLSIKKEQWYLLATYKNPKVSNDLYVENLTCFYNELLTGSRAKEIIMLGDVNINLLQTPNCLSDMFDVYGLSNMINSPTCYKSTRGTLIDPVVVLNDKRFFQAINVQCGMSDWHNLVGCVTKINLPRVAPKTIVYRSYKDFDNDAFTKDMSYAPFHVNEIFDDVNDKYWFVSKLCSDVINKHAPMKKRVLKSSHVPYMNSKLRKQMYKRNNARNKYVKQRTDYNWNIYRMERNKTTAMRRESIKNFFVSRCSSATNPSDFWKCIRPFLSFNSQVYSDINLNEDGQVTTNPTEVSGLMNEFFANVASGIGMEDSIHITENSNWLGEIFARHENHPSVQAIAEVSAGADEFPFNFKKITTETVKKKLQQIKPNKATGYDNIPPKLAQRTSSETAAAIAHVINSSFATEVFPDDLKLAEIVPLHKKGNNMLKENYRPVSVLAVFDKIFENIIADQMTDFFKMKYNDLLCAYRKNYGSCHILINLLESWKLALDQKKIVGTLLMDLSKAFDCVPHGLLLCKLKAYGFSDSACKLMASYLSDRKQRVKINDKRSSWAKISKGIPQGSCLGPIIFNIFVNDIFYFIKKCSLVNYADDNTLSISGESFDVVTAALQLDAENSIKWFNSNFMKINPDKFQIMCMTSVYSSEELPSRITISGHELKNEDFVQLLGITIDSKLTFDRHIDGICKKASRQLNILRRFQNALHLKEMTLVYNAFVCSNFNYCPIVWHFCSTASIRKMEKIQERALRLLHKDNTSTYEELLRKSKQATLHVKRLRLIAQEVFKSIYQLNPAFMRDLFQPKVINHNLRDENKLVMPSFNTLKYGKNTFTYHGAHIWNLLPAHLKDNTDFKVFKTMLNSWEGPQCQCSSCSVMIL